MKFFVSSIKHSMICFNMFLSFLSYPDLEMHFVPYISMDACAEINGRLQ